MKINDALNKVLNCDNQNIEFVYTDGGREKAGFKGTTGDCVIRAIAVATEKDYKEVYNDIYEATRKYAETRNNKLARHLRNHPNKMSPREGVYKEIYRPYLESLGWKYISDRQRLNCNKFKSGTYICRVTRHMTVVKNGKLYDSWNCSMARDGYDKYGNYFPSKVRTAFHHYVKI